MAKNLWRRLPSFRLDSRNFVRTKTTDAVALVTDDFFEENPYLLSGSGSFSVTGNAAVLNVTRVVFSDAASFQFTGQSASIIKAGTEYALECVGGIFTLSGYDATISFARSVSAGCGTFAMTGIDAGLSRIALITAPAATFALSGIDATIRCVRLIAANAASYALSGKSAVLRYAFAPRGTRADVSSRSTNYSVINTSAQTVIAGRSRAAPVSVRSSGSGVSVRSTRVSVKDR